jgi:uncharacterized membrane protein YbhN (UPF0104 family)
MKLKNNKWLKVGLLVLTLIAFVYYFLHNQEQFSRIGHLTWWQVLLIIVGQTIVFFSNILVSVIFIQFIGKKLHFLDSTRITAYSSLVNFFGFLQGGVGLRGVYFKRQFSMSLKKYFALTVIQYLFLFAVAGLFVLVGISFTTGLSSALLMTALGVVILASGIVLFGKSNTAKKLQNKLGAISQLLRARPLTMLFAVIILQLGGSLLANFVELQAIGANISIGGVLVYTGTSQFAIVIALTPGAIGIREALLLVVQQQMHLTTQDIVLAATVDRVVYFITLALITPFALAAKKQLPAKEIEEASAS